eukprot:gene27920-36781_t
MPWWVEVQTSLYMELLRQAIIDVSIMLRKRGLLFHRTLFWLQYDNCGDNKNQESYFLGLGTASSSSSHISTVAPKSMHDMLSNADQIKFLRDVNNSLLGDFEKISLRSIQQQEQRRNDEADGLPVQRVYQHQEDMQRKMMDQNSGTETYIIYLAGFSWKKIMFIYSSWVDANILCPADSLEQVDELLSATAKEDREDTTNSSGPPYKRTKSSSSKDDSKAAVLKRQVKAAKSDATTCRWVLKQLDIDRIRRIFEDEFEYNHFLDTNITNAEVKWLEDHNSVEKVLSINCLAYATAPKWEAFPRTTLSEVDLRRIAEEIEKHLKAVEE